MIGDVKDTARADDDRLFLFMLQQIFKETAFPSALKFIPKFLRLNPHLRHSD
jgi:hypothetical protein